MKYKPGDKVRIKSFAWYYSNSDCMGNVQCGDWYFTDLQTSYCGKVLTISAICDDFYLMKGIGHHWTDEMIEGLADAEPQEKMVSLDDACKWLRANINLYADTRRSLFSNYQEVYLTDNFETEFCKAMESVFRKRLEE